ncbi:MAG: ABC transporter substrate-binding protein [Chloroflexi bacterium]|nr:ABC transporter substrate-binding protein [Chloroflexota bacterium]
MPVVGLAVVSGGCGGAGSRSQAPQASPGASSQSQAPQASPAASGEAIKIGVMGPFTGFASYVGPGLLTGVKAAIEQINAAGGVNGRMLSSFTADDAGDPATAVTAYRKMLSVDKPAVIIGSFSWTNPALLPLVGSTQVPDFMLGGTTQLNNVNNPYFWRTQPNDNWQAAAHAYYAISKGWKKGAFAYATTNSAQTLKIPTRAAYVGGGGTIVSESDLVPGATSYRSVILNLIAAKPDVVFFEMDPGTAGTFFRQAAQLGFNTKTQWIGTDTDYSIEFFKAVGADLATKNLVVTTGADQAGPPADTFALWNQKANNLTTPALSATYGYDAVITAALAMQAAGSTAGPDINNKILAVSSPPGTAVSDFAQGKTLLSQGQEINYEGVGSSVDFDQTHNVVGPWGVYKFTSTGSLELVTTLTAEQLAQFAGPAGP